jgi:hypothetical protein
MTKINTAKFKKAIKGTRGIITRIAEKLGTTRKSVYEYMEKHPELQNDINQEKERLIDMAEHNLYSRIEENDWKATSFLLSTLGKDRGFTERVENVQEFKEKPVFQVDFVKPDHDEQTN